MNDKTTRDHIVDAADQLFYQQGFEHTSFSDIADVVQISRGNFYHHFKSKDEILTAVIAQRLANTQKLLDKWESETTDPMERIRSFIHILIANRKKIMRFGCPVGTLCNELAKLDHVSHSDANKLFLLFHAWLSRQLVLLGCQTDADAQAMHLLARSQGIATLANAFHDEVFIEREVKALCEWLTQLVTGAAPTSGPNTWRRKI